MKQYAIHDIQRQAVPLIPIFPTASTDLCSTVRAGNVDGERLRSFALDSRAGRFERTSKGRYYSAFEDIVPAITRFNLGIVEWTDHIDVRAVISWRARRIFCPNFPQICKNFYATNRPTTNFMQLLVHYSFLYTCCHTDFTPQMGLIVCINSIVTKIHDEIYVNQSCKTGRAGFGLKCIKMFRACIQFFSIRLTLLSPVTVEAIEMITSSIKMINCELLGRVYFPTALKPRSCAYLDLFGNFGFRV